MEEPSLAAVPNKGSPVAPTTKELEKFFKRCGATLPNFSANGPCCLWMGDKGGNRARFFFRGKRASAQRLAFSWYIEDLGDRENITHIEGEQYGGQQLPEPVEEEEEEECDDATDSTTTSCSSVERTDPKRAYKHFCVNPYHFRKRMRTRIAKRRELTEKQMVALRARIAEELEARKETLYGPASGLGRMCDDLRDKLFLVGYLDPVVNLICNGATALNC
jgi:hypothetical protein